MTLAMLQDYKWTRLIISIASFFIVTSCAGIFVPSVSKELIQLKKGEYTLDPKHSSLIFKVNHLGLSDYVGRFNRFEASLNFEPEDLNSMQLEAIIDTSSIDVNNSDFEETLREANWFNSSEYPQAYFVSTTIKQVSKMQFLIVGNLTIKDVTKPIDLKLTFNGGASNFLTGNYTIGFHVTGQLKRSEFRIEDYMGFVGDQIKIEVNGEFLKN